MTRTRSKMPPSGPRLLYSIQETAYKLSCSTRHVYNLIRDGKLEAIGSRRGRRVIGDSIDGHIDRQREAA